MALDGVGPRITEIRDKASESVPSVSEMRKSQQQGSTGNGLPENGIGGLLDNGNVPDIRD